MSSGLGLLAAIAGLPDEVAAMTRDETFKQQWLGQCPGHCMSKDIRSNDRHQSSR